MNGGEWQGKGEEGTERGMKLVCKIILFKKNNNKRERMEEKVAAVSHIHSPLPKSL